MPKGGARPGPPRTNTGHSTRQAIIKAAVETLKREGFAGTSARAVAQTGAFNQALIFYHFGGMSELLVAVLDHTSEQRMQRYRTALAEVTTVADLVQVAGKMYREDLEAGHVKVLAELIGAATTVPELAPEVAARIEPWVALTEDTLARVTAASPFGEIVPTGDVAYAVVALYVGMEMLTHLQGDRYRAGALFDAAARLVPVLRALGA